MPLWESYEVEAETRITVRAGAQVVVSYVTYGAAKGSSNEQVNPGGMLDAVMRAAQQALVNAEAMGVAARKTRRAELGYRDGD